MRSLVPLLIGAPLLTACVGREAFVPGQEAASVVVWYETYLAGSIEVPPVQWVFQEHLNCDPHDGHDFGFYAPDSYDSPDNSSDCVGGVTFWESVGDTQLWGPVSEVGMPDGFAFHQTSFAHELYHAYLYLTTGDGDSSHKNAGFGVGYGHPFGLVDEANQNLQDRDL